MWYANIISGMVVLLMGIAITYLAWLMPYTADFGPGPGFLPFWLGVILTICSIPIIIASLRNKDKSGNFFQPETVKCVKVLILIIAVYLILPVLGFPVSLALITAGGMRLMGKHSWVSCVVTVIVTAVCIHYLFGKQLNIPLPEGMFGW